VGFFCERSLALYQAYKSMRRKRYCLQAVSSCNTLQHAATYCITLQHTATHCNTGQNRVLLGNGNTQFLMQTHSHYILGKTSPLRAAAVPHRPHSPHRQHRARNSSDEEGRKKQGRRKGKKRRMKGKGRRRGNILRIMTLVILYSKNGLAGDKQGETGCGARRGM